MIYFLKAETTLERKFQTSYRIKEDMMKQLMISKEDFLNSFEKMEMSQGENFEEGKDSFAQVRNFLC